MNDETEIKGMYIFNINPSNYTVRRLVNTEINVSNDNYIHDRPAPKGRIQSADIILVSLR